MMHLLESGFRPSLPTSFSSVATQRRSLRWHTALLAAGLVILYATIGAAIMSPAMAIALAAGAFVSIFLTPRSLARRILRRHDARALDRFTAPRLHAVTADLARRGGLASPPNLYLLPSDQPIAFTTRDGARNLIALSSGLLQQLSPRELTGVVAHEISHLKNRDLLLLSWGDILRRHLGVLGIGSLLFLLLGLPVLTSPHPMLLGTVLPLLIVAHPLANLLFLALSRTREFAADLSACELTGDPAGLASALRRIEQTQRPLWQRVLLPRHDPFEALYRTHPSTPERIRRLSALAPTRTTSPDMLLRDLLHHWGLHRI